MSLAVVCRLLGRARALLELGELALGHQAGDDGIGLGHAQLTLRLDGDECPSQNRRMQDDGDDKPELHWASLASLPQPSVSVTSDTLLNPPCLMRAITRITVP